MLGDGVEAYFAPLLPWQARAWQQVTEQFYHKKLAHGLLVAGPKGIGKRQFVWRLVAYMLCHRSDEMACGTCESCHWLRSGTHPDLLVLPTSALPDAQDAGESIKIDDIRTLSDYSQTKGHTAKIIVLDQVDGLGVAAANALLKTLEEPRDGVFLILISDRPSRILPTIRSRVQALPLSCVDRDLALSFLSSADTQGYEPQLLLDLADGAVLQALDLPNQAWLGQRKAWLATLVALKTKKRTVTAAVNYWQKTLSLPEFLYLSRVMLVDVYRVALGLPSLHQDLDVVSYVGQLTLFQSQLDELLARLDQLELAIGQNVQEKIAYTQCLVLLS